jgi:hypothetical protein
MFAQYSQVKIVALRPSRTFDSWRMNRRQPAIGEVGSIVEIFEQPGDTIYLVECVNSGGSTEWLEEFLESELAPHTA